VELREREKDTNKQERRERIEESRYNREYERGNSGVCTWGESAREIKEKEMKEDAECAMRRERQLSTCGIDVAK
jgi:hypothetical protein